MVLGWFQTLRDAALVVAAVLNLGSNNVCYESEDGPIGCFSNAWPFNNALGMLPQSPEEIQTTFRLYTRSTVAINPSAVVFRPNADSLGGTDFQGSRPTKIIIHGFKDTAVDTWVQTMALAILEKDDVNVIAVDWAEGASRNVYSLAAANTRVVGALIHQLMAALVQYKGANVADMHLIGHSLGAHIAGYTGAANPGMGRITGLDPAGLRFEYRNTTVRLDPTDAQFVDVIHTNGRAIATLGFGSRVSMGHVDFFPNGGGEQPGCNPTSEDLLEAIESDRSEQVELATNLVICSHSRAYRLFTESISDSCRFMASRQCQSYQQFLDGWCPCGTDQPCVAMGYSTPTDAPRGNYYLTTNSESPYCMS